MEIYMAWLILIIAGVAAILSLLAYVGDQQYYGWLSKEYMIPHDMKFLDRVKIGIKIIIRLLCRSVMVISPIILIFWAAITVDIL